MEEQEIIKELDALKVSSSFISRNIRQFQRMYPKKFIAVKDGKLIVVDSDFYEIMRKLKEMGVNPASTLVEYVPSEDEILVNKDLVFST